MTTVDLTTSLSSQDLVRTAMLPFLARADDATRPDAILGDHAAYEARDPLEAHFGSTPVSDSLRIGWWLRNKAVDEWCQSSRVSSGG